MKSDRLANLIGALALSIADDIEAENVPDGPGPGRPSSAIVLISQADGMSIDRLRRALRMSHAAAVRLVDRLETAGLVKRSSSELDRRAVALHVTSHGFSIAKRLKTARLNKLLDVVQLLTPPEQNLLEQVLEKLLVGKVTTLDDAHSTCRHCDWKSCWECPLTPLIADEQ